MGRERSDGSESQAKGLEDLTTHQREELLRVAWMYHDYQWFRFVAEERGFEAANDPNQAILGRMAHAEMMRLMRALDVREVNDMPTLVRCSGPPANFTWEGCVR